jgi:hypothetical protein
MKIDFVLLILLTILIICCTPNSENKNILPKVSAHFLTRDDVLGKIKVDILCIEGHQYYCLYKWGSVPILDDEGHPIHCE